MAVKHLKMLQRRNSWAVKTRPSVGSYIADTGTAKLPYIIEREKGVCYAGAPFANAKKLLIFMDGVMNLAWVQKDKMREYYRWLIQDSPFESMYLNKNPDWCLENGFAIRCNGNKKEMLHACILLRVWECGDSAKIMFRLLDEGCEPLMALIGQWFLEETGFAFTFRNSGRSMNHNVISSYYLQRNVMKNVIQNVKNLTGTVHTLYGVPANSFWDRREIQSLIPKKEVKKPYVSPFPALNRMQKESAVYTPKQVADAFNLYYQSLLTEISKETK